MTALLALIPLLVGGPGWTLLLCWCGDVPKTHCCCCPESQDAGPAVASMAGICEHGAIDKTADSATPAHPTEGELAAPFLELPRIAAARPTLRMPAPVDPTLARRGSVPPHLSVCSLRRPTAAYIPVMRFVVRHRWRVVCLAAGPVAFTVPAFLRLESEFMPPLEELDPRSPSTATPPRASGSAPTTAAR